jgi:penicillin-binding protein 2
MELKGNLRVFIFAGIVLLLFSVLVIQLAQLTLAQGSEYDSKSILRTKATLTVKGSRGIIMDKNGIPLAYDEKSYNVEFQKDPTRTTSKDRAFYTDVLMKAIDVIEKNKGKIVDVLNIKRDSTGKLQLDFNTKNAEAFKKREDRWRQDMYVPVKDYPTAESIYNFLRGKYQIPEELSFEQASKLLSIWQEVQLNAGSMYKPVLVAENVNVATVAQLKTYSNELEGIQITESTVRMYPRGSTAAHVVGYMGRIDDTKLDEMTAKGYQPEDKMGVAGIEQKMESELTCDTKDRLGSKQVEVTRSGKIMRDIPGTAKDAKSGNSVMLTIDLKLQQALEQVLEQSIVTIRKEEEKAYADDKADYDKELAKLKRKAGDIKFAESGGAVVLDANTGKVLALASYPTYDLNIFTDGLTEEEWAPLRDENSTPTFNKAVSSKAIPGSIFKMVTGLAGLMEGKLSLTEQIDDEGKYDKYTESGEASGTAPKCWTYPHLGDHQNQTIEKGLANSCNYFFMTVADRLGIDLINKWGHLLGLDSKTGIELPLEATGQVGNQKVLYDNTKPLDGQVNSIPRLVKNAVKRQLKKYGELRRVTYSDAELDNASEQILRLVGTKDKNGKEVKELGPYIRQVMQQTLGINQRASLDNRWDKQIAGILTEIMWNPNLTLRTGFGQGIAAVTPVEIARYVAAIVNGGTVFNVHVVDKILAPDGTIIKETKPEIYQKLDIPKEYLDALKRGMQEVVSPEDRGTAAAFFKDFPKKYRDNMGGKTGTAEVSTIDIENNSWFVAFAPYEKPEIVVVSYVPHGYKGGLSSIVARDIIQYYLNNKERKAKDDIPAANSILGDLYEDKPSASKEAN